jgi:ribosomal protein S18 acetylase RimI-like enzyme
MRDPVAVARGAAARDVVAIVAVVTRTLRLDDATIRRLERHESDAHAIPGREVRDLGDALLLFDPRDVDPFWNRMVSVRWPDDPAAFDRRLAEALALFGLLARRPHVWPSPDHGRPGDLVARLEANGFRDVGGGHVMVLQDPAACAPVGAGELEPGTSIRTIARAEDSRATDLDDAAGVLVEAFGAPPRRTGELAADLLRALDDPRIVLALARVDGVAAAVAKATTFDGCSYLSSIGTRPAFRGRGLAGLVTRQAVAAASRPEVRITYLGVFSGNAPAIHLYERLGFASIGESPDLLLE